MLHSAPATRGSVTPADAPLIQPKTLFRQTKPPQLFERGVKFDNVDVANRINVYTRFVAWCGRIEQFVKDSQSARSIAVANALSKYVKSDP